MEWLAEKAVMVTALSAILAILLIFLFVGRKALPVLTEESVRQTANPTEFFTPNSTTPKGQPAYVWQPIAERPKYSFVPLLIGTLKATLMAMLSGCPVGVVGGALHRRICTATTARIHQTRD